MKFSKKILAAFLAALMAISMMPFSAITAFAALTPSGSCGENATYLLEDTDSDGNYDKLTISGTGAMADYTSRGAPWYSYSERQNLKTVVIEEGITSVGNYAFFNLDHAISLSIASTVETLGTSSFQYYGYYSTNVLTNVTLPDALTNIGDIAFAGWQSLQSVTIPAGVTSIGSQTFAGCSALSTVTFARPSTSHNLAVGVKAFSSGSIAFSGTGADLYDGETEITAGTVASSLGGKTLNWVSTTPTTGFMVGEDWYDDFEEAVAAARTGSVKTVTCLSDVDLTSYAASARHYIDITGVTIDLNDHQMDVGTHWSVCFTGTNGKIMNGTCVGHDSPAYENYAYGIYIWGPGSGNVANSGGQKATIELEDLVCNYGIHCWNADVTIKDCDVTGSNSYYAVWADENTNVTIESGNFTTNGAAVLGAAKSSDGDGNISVEGGDFVVPAGKKLAQSGTSSKPENVQVSGGTFNVVVPVINCADGYVPVTTPDPVTGKYEVKEAREDGFNLTIEDKIYMNLYVNVDEYVSENATLSITYNDPDAQSPTAKTDTYSGADLAALKDSEDGRYIVSVLAAPAQMRDEVTVAVKNGTSVVHTFTTCVADYCEAIVAMYAGNETEAGRSGNLCRLGRALLDYGKACSDEFNYNESAFASQDYYNPETNEFNHNAEYFFFPNAYIYTGNANGKFKSYSYIAKSIPALRIYLNATEAEVLSNDLKAYVNGEEVAITVVEGTDKVCVDITGILAENFHDEYTIDFNGGSMVITALQYAKAKGGTTDFGRSMTFYWDAARNFFDDAH